MRFTRRKGVLLIVLAPLLFVFSGLFLANTILNPVESSAYQAGKVLCFIVVPILLISGIVVCIRSPHEKKEKLAAAPPEKKPVVYSATRLRLLLVSRVIGAAFAIILLAAPFIGEAEGSRGVAPLSGPARGFSVSGNYDALPGYGILPGIPQEASMSRHTRNPRLHGNTAVFTNAFSLTGLKHLGRDSCRVVGKKEACSTEA
jgi:hypothetical protein